MSTQIITPGHQNSIAQILRQRAQSQPDRAAFRFLRKSIEEDVLFTYGDLDLRASSIASAMQGRVSAGDRVLLVLAPGADFVSALFACFYLGVVVVPGLDPEGIASASRVRLRLAPILRDSGAKLILTDSTAVARIEAGLDNNEVSLLAVDEVSSSTSPRLPIEDHELAIVQYTSGSTAEPRGVVLRQTNILANLRAIQSCFELNSESIGVIWLPPYHDMGLIGGILEPVFAGFPTVILRPRSFLRDPLLWLRAISQHHGTISGGPNFAYEYCMQRADPASVTSLDLSSWKIAFNGSEPPKAETIDRFASMFTQAGFSRRAFCCCYGLAESTLLVTAAHLDMDSVVSAVDSSALASGRVEPPQGGRAKLLVSSGSVIPGHKLKIADHGAGKAEVGEIWVAGPSCAVSYWQRDRESSETFVEVSDNGERETFLRTGDLGFVQNGQLFVVGRVKDILIVNGENYYPEDIESAAESYQSDLPLGAIACICGEENNELVILAELKVYERQDDETKQRYESVAAAIRDRVLDRCGVHLASVLLLPPGSIYKTRSGKLRRHACHRAYTEDRFRPLYVCRTTGASQAGETPQIDIDEVVSRLCWLGANAMGRQGLSATENFFESGMHSLSAAAFISSIRASFGVDVPFRALFEQPTAQRLATVVRKLIEKPGDPQAALWPRATARGRHQGNKFPLNDVQHAYWIGRSTFYELGNIGTHVYTEYDCPGFDLRRFQDVWRALIERHDMLRAIVRPDGEQEILEDVPAYEIATLDLSKFDDASRNAALQQVRDVMSHQVFSTESWPIWELRASVLGSGVVRLHCSLDLLIADLWSTQILFREMALLYESPGFQLPELEIGFREYLLAEREFQHGELFHRAEQYWMQRIPNLPPAPELPLAKSSKDVKEPAFARRRGRVDRECWAQIKQRAAQAGLTPSGCLLAAYAEILATWSKNSRFTINLTLFNRLPLHEQVESIVGDFTSLTLLAVESCQSTFTARARAIQEQLWQDLEARHFSGIRVMRLLAKNRGITEMPVVFTSSLVHGESTRFPFGQQVFGISQTPQIWLDHQVFEEDGALVFNWDAIEEMFPTGCLDEMFASYVRLLNELASRDEAWYAVDRRTVPPSQLARRQRINATEGPVSNVLLQDLFLASARRFPDATAIAWKNGSMGYRELLSIAARTGRHLRKFGARPNRLVAIIMKKGWEQIAAALGVLFSGAAYLSIDPELPPARQRYLLENSGAEMALTNCDLAPIVANCSTTRIFQLKGDVFPDESSEPLEPMQLNTDLAYVMYTSGSTGKPKGVMIDHCGVVNTILDMNRRFQVGPDDAVLAISALNFDLSVYDVFGLLAAGGKVVLPLSGDRLEPAHWYELISQENVTIWSTVPALKEMFVDYASSRDGLGRCGSLRLVLLSGDWIPMALPNRIKALFPQAKIISLGGATEASIWSILFPIDAIDSSWKSIPYGKPMANQNFEVLNDELQPCPEWTVGELYIGGLGLAQGYWNDEQRTRARFIRHPKTGVRLYRTGDLGRYLPDGNIEFLGREDFQVKIHGHRIELGEIEAALHALPGIQQAVVVAPGEKNQRRLVGWVKSSGMASPLMENSGEPAWAESTWNSALAAGRLESMKVTAVDPALWTQLLQRIDEWVASVSAATLASLGLFVKTEDCYSVGDAICIAGIIPRYRKWLIRALSMLVEDELLTFDGSFYRCRKPLQEADWLATWNELRTELDRCGFPGEGFELAGRSARALPAILHGQDQAVAALFVGGEIDSAARMYQAEFDYCNRMCAEIARAIASHWPQDHPLRILEIGAGVGSTTRYLLPALRPAPGQYVFSDISKFFLNAAPSTFGDFPFMEFRILDIQNDPVLNGFKPHSFDIIVAASVLHATRNMQESIGNVASLLAPGGILLLLEETKFPRIFNLTMGLQQGFDDFVDYSLRKEQPLLSFETWRRLLIKHGFQSVEDLGDACSSAEMLGFKVVLARNSRQVSELSVPKLKQALAGSIADYMCPSEFIVVENLPLSSNGKIDRATLLSLSQGRALAHKEYVAPSTAIEKTTAELVAQVLQLERVGLEDEFFELGGDSLLATQLITKLRSSLELEIPLSLVFQNRTVAGMARAIEQIRANAQLPLVELLEASGQ